MHPFSTPWKHHKTARFSDVIRGVEKGRIAHCERMGQQWVEDSIKRFSFQNTNCPLTMFLLLLYVNLSWTCSHKWTMLFNFCVFYTGSIRFYFHIFSLFLFVELLNFHRIKIRSNRIGLAALQFWKWYLIYRIGFVAMIHCRDQQKKHSWCYMLCCNRGYNKDIWLQWSYINFEKFSCNGSFQGNNVP